MALTGSLLTGEMPHFDEMARIKIIVNQASSFHAFRRIAFARRQDDAYSIGTGAQMIGKQTMLFVAIFHIASDEHAVFCLSFRANGIITD